MFGLAHWLSQISDFWVLKSTGSSRKKKMDGNLESEQLQNRTRIVLDYDMLFEILSRVQVKSLMRFKSVCRHWHYLIQHDQYFRDSHLTQSKSNPIILFITISSSSQGGEDSLSSVRLHDCLQTSQYHKTTVPYVCIFMKPINGLICFRESNNDIFVYNLSTREKKQLGTGEEEERKYKTSLKMTGIPQLGFDPITKVYKVVRMPSVEKNWQRRWFCEVFTIGKDDSWRRIGEINPAEFSPEFSPYSSVYANGSIFWMRPGKEFKFIVAFDVGSEKFRYISTPILINNKCRLLEIDGCVSLLDNITVGRRIKNTFKLWILHEGLQDNEENKSANWIEETIDFEFNADLEYVAFVVAIEGTDLIIIRHGPTKSCGNAYYRYDRKKKTSKLLATTGWPSSVTSYTESLFSL